MPGGRCFLMPGRWISLQTHATAKSHLLHHHPISGTAGNTHLCRSSFCTTSVIYKSAPKATETLPSVTVMMVVISNVFSLKSDRSAAWFLTENAEILVFPTWLAWKLFNHRSTWVAYQPGTRQRFCNVQSFWEASGPAVITSWKVYFRATESSCARWCCGAGGGVKRAQLKGNVDWGKKALAVEA